MTMQHQIHPDDERLAALAGADPDATADARLGDHVRECERCSEIVRDLTALRSALAELPDIAPSRPLVLLPPARESVTFADRLAGAVRRTFAPALTAGATLALVGAVGTFSPYLAGGQAAAPAAAEYQERAPGEAFSVPTDLSEPDASRWAALQSESPVPVVGGDTSQPSESPTRNVGGAAAASAGATPTVLGGDVSTEGGGEEGSLQPLTAERSIWPMVLFAGVAVMIAAALLRWILQPRTV
jgi:hypothetical protein